MRKVCTTVAVTLTALGVLGRAPLTAAADVRAGARVLDLVRTDQPPAIDGVLDDPAWATPALDLSEWMTYNPVRGQKLTQNTEVRLTYDDIGLYIAFHCVDPEPAKVRATMGRRDQLWSDDWVGLSLDAIGNGQQSYDLFVNPLGVQADILDTSTAGEDTAPDWVWDSAGRLTPEGYDVEIRLPWKSVRFTSGAEVKMGVLFWRKVSRIGMSASWPELPDGKWVFECHAPLRLHNLRRPLALEVVPSTTFARNEERVSPTAFGKAENDPDVGLSVKYGVTSTTSVEATVNPDFSQVESDAFQVEVNQRYPVFYSEKRPFFMEGMGTFQLAGTGGDAVMSTAVHTRRIVDPVWGGKAAGSLGRVTFAALASSDSAPGRAPDVDRQLSGENRTFLVGRATWSLGRSNYFGVIATDTEFGSGFNRVGGGDLSWRKGAHTWNATLLGSQARPPTGGEETSGAAGQASYSFQTKRWEAVTQTEHYDRNFQMDTAFLKQTGITSNWSYGQLSLYPDEKKHAWFKKFSTFVFGRAGRDRIQGGDVLFGLVGVRANFTRQGFLRVDAGWGQEPWAQQEFQTRDVRVMGQVQIFKWLNLDTYMSKGQSVYYDSTDPFVGPSWYHSLGMTFQPMAGFQQSVYWERSELNRPDDGPRVYRVDLLNVRASYQFDRRFSLRGIARYDSDKRKVLTDLLASFEPVPGTVVYAGYGSLLEQRGWDGAAFVSHQGDYLVTQRGLFFKASYAKRF
jgi:hypothetical protein